MLIAQDGMTRSSAAFLPLDADRKRRLIVAIANSVISHVDELTTLAAAIGDGDHGHNMKRGFDAALQDLDALSAMDLPDLLKAIGTKLVMKVGGASGPLYGTLFLALGKALPPEPSRSDASSSASDLAAVKKTAALSAEATASMRATRGRASFLGERSIGHVDPG